jgi:hypothetical protein
MNKGKNCRMEDECSKKSVVKFRFRIGIPDHFDILQPTPRKTQVFLSYMLTEIRGGVEL